MDRLEPHLNEGRFAFGLEMLPEERATMKRLFLLTAKPTLFACNVAEEDLGHPESNPWVGKVRDYAAQHHGSRAVVVSAEIESELCTLPPDERAEYLAELGVDQSGSGTLIKEAYYLLGLRTYLTTGEKETRAWTIRAGDKAPVAAGVIHSDFEKSFISAETVGFDDLVACASIARARELGKLRTEGKEYIVQDGDVMEFKTFL
jgi:ribosome-binding ATPase YchF (GTP1/OBG family)